MTRDDWTPYGLEAIRIAHLRRRRILAAIIVLGLALMWMLMVSQTTSTQTDIFANGKRANGLQLDVPEPPEEDKPVTITIEPGRITRAESTGNAPADQLSRPDRPVLSRGNALNWNYYLTLYGPYLLVAGAIWMLSKRRGKHDEINFGVHKGAMPLEMISAVASREIYTTRHARRSLFGKRREDYLPERVRASGSGEEN